MRIKPRRDKGPRLIQHYGQRRQESRHQQNFQRHHEGRNDRGGDHRRALRQVRHQRRGQPVIQRLGAGEKAQNDGHRNHRQSRLDQPAAQLHQVRHEGLLSARQLVFWRIRIGFVGLVHESEGGIRAAS